jgi:tRNA A37 threonylcarbamoyladenosine modification protein TsaB
VPVVIDARRGYQYIAIFLLGVVQAVAWAQEPAAMRLEQNLPSCANCHGSSAFIGRATLDYSKISNKKF